MGETYYLGHDCKTLREVTPEGSGTMVMYQNLILRLLSTEGDMNVTSLKIYDEIENPITITLTLIDIKVRADTKSGISPDLS